MTDPTNSSVTGFGDSKVSPLPFQSNVDADNVQLSVALRHRVQIGFEFDVTIFDVGANLGIYLDLPGLEANVTHLTDVDENCVSVANSQSLDKNTSQAVLTDVYEITPTVFWGVGFDGTANVSSP